MAVIIVPPSAHLLVYVFNLRGMRFYKPALVSYYAFIYVFAVLDDFSSQTNKSIKKARNNEEA
jgi:hypothetical protein